jgi:predicted membrane channel-forming protein YqfA (hemolysin III family)
MFAVSMPGLAEWILILFFIGYIWLVLSTVVNIAKNTQLEMNHKLFWILILVLAPILGVVIYYIFYKNVSSKT